MPLFELSLIFIAGLAAGLFGTLVGGGNMLTIPLGIFLGYPVHETLAFNRVGTVGLTMSGYYKFNKMKLVNHKIGIFIALFAVFGAYLGTKIVLGVSSDILEKLVGAIILIVLLFTLLNRNMGLEAKILSKRHFLIGTVASFAMGLYIGFIGLAAGTFLIMLGVFIFGQTFLQSTATIKIPGFVTNVISAFVFWLSGLIIWDVAITLFISMFIGSYIGAHYSEKIGNLWLKRMFIAVSVIMALMLLF